MSRQARLLLIAATAMAPLVAGSIAWACTGVAEIRTEEAAVVQGAEVRGSGEGFSADAAGQAEVHLDGESGQLMWQGRPDTAGGISFNFVVGDAQPGQHVLVAVQRDASGEPVYGTPARTTIEVSARSASASSSPPAARADQAPAEAALSPTATPASGSSAAPSAVPTAPQAVTAGAIPEAPAPADTVAASSLAPESAPPLAASSAPRDVAPVPNRSVAAPRSVSVGTTPESGSLVLPFVLTGLALLLATAAAVVALRSDRKDLAPARRRAHR